MGSLYFGVVTREVTDVKAEQFLLADSGEGDEQRILIFGRESFQDWSHLIEELYVDGTFLICPVLFYQFFVVLARRNDYVLPIFYCLLPNKNENTYARTFGMIRRIFPNLNPDSISVDFELAIHNAIRTIFLNLIFVDVSFTYSLI
uniref:Uncharacterized protein n=1 Tax=Meloidogyne enterolobii TaxID=390850 RepID=A0A6V7TP28_MELEN|nr:unnamed protein product [Meloidogyne enterolobii]